MSTKTVRWTEDAREGDVTLFPVPRGYVHGSAVRCTERGVFAVKRVSGVPLWDVWPAFDPPCTVIFPTRWETFLFRIKGWLR